MNIFVTDPDPWECAAFMDDRRANKMLIESVQMISHVIGGPYKLTHTHHPCTKWVKADLRHAYWLHCHITALAQRYTDKTGKEHLSYTKYTEHIDPGFFDDIAIETDFDELDYVNCTSFKNIPVFEAYRMLLEEKWQKEAKKSLIKIQEIV